MAAQQLEKLKPGALMLFVALNVILVILIWIENLFGPGPGGSGFTRATPEVGQTRITQTTLPTRPAPSSTPLPVATPAPTYVLPDVLQDK